MSSTTALPQASKTLDQACPIQRTPGIIQLPPNRSLNKSKNKSKGGPGGKSSFSRDMNTRNR